MYNFLPGQLLISAGFCFVMILSSNAISFNLHSIVWGVSGRDDI